MYVDRAEIVALHTVRGVTDRGTGDDTVKAIGARSAFYVLGTEMA